MKCINSVNSVPLRTTVNTSFIKSTKKAQREGWHCCCHQKYRLQCLFQIFSPLIIRRVWSKVACTQILYTDNSITFWAQTNKTMTAICHRQLKCLRGPVYIKAFDTRVTNLICSTRINHLNQTHWELSLIWAICCEPAMLCKTCSSIKSATLFVSPGFTYSTRIW